MIAWTRVPRLEIQSPTSLSSRRTPSRSTVTYVLAKLGAVNRSEVVARPPSPASSRERWSAAVVVGLSADGGGGRARLSVEGR